MSALAAAARSAHGQRGTSPKARLPHCHGGDLALSPPRRPSRPMPTAALRLRRHSRRPARRARRRRTPPTGTVPRRRLSQRLRPSGLHRFLLLRLLRHEAPRRRELALCRSPLRALGDQLQQQLHAQEPDPHRRTPFRCQPRPLMRRYDHLHSLAAHQHPHSPQRTLPLPRQAPLQQQHVARLLARQRAPAPRRYPSKQLWSRPCAAEGPQAHHRSLRAGCQPGEQTRPQRLPPQQHAALQAETPPHQPRYAQVARGAGARRHLRAFRTLQTETGRRAGEAKKAHQTKKKATRDAAPLAASAPTRPPALPRGQCHVKRVQRWSATSNACSGGHAWPGH